VTEPNEGPATNERATARRGRTGVLEIAETLFLTIAIFLIVQNFVAQPFKVEQRSMERTVEPGEYVLVDKLTPHFATYARGDVVVFTPPADPVETNGVRTPYIKRVVGLPGEEVEVRDGAILIDGRKLAEPYVYEGQSTEQTGSETRWTVPEGELFLLGDHRQASSDSREFGPVPIENLVGRVVLRYWPLSALGPLPDGR
jgi:signal peptidase I